MKTIINVECMDQELVITNSPVIASGGVHENFIAFNFCEKWDGLGKTAVFYRNEKERFYSVLGPDDVCEIPHEVTDYEGTMYFGVYGEAGEVTRTSKVVKYKITKGAMTTLLKPSEEPTPDIYQQLLSAYGQTNEALARETAEREASMMAEESARNSAINTAILAEENARKQADATEKAERQTEIAVERERINALIALEESSEATDVEKEIEDIKVKADGTKAETAGVAVREQVNELNTKIDDNVGLLSSEIKERVVKAFGTGISANNYTKYLTDANNCKNGDTYFIYKNITEDMVANLPSYGEFGIITTFHSFKGVSSHGKYQLFVTPTKMFWRFEYGSDAEGATWVAWKQVITDFSVSDFMCVGMSPNVYIEIDAESHTLSLVGGGYIWSTNNFIRVENITERTISLIPTSDYTYFVYIRDNTLRLERIQKYKPVSGDIIIAELYIADDGTVQEKIWIAGNDASRIKELEAQVKTLALTGTPTNHNTCAIFKRVVCVGDSYTSGHISAGKGTTTTNEEFAYPSFMARLTGNEYINCGKSGANVLTWQTDERGLPKAQATGKVQAYLVGLGLNDVQSGTERYVELGSVADIGTNAQTYYGGLSTIIRELASISPNAMIFLQTMPSTNTTRMQYNEAIRNIVSAYADTYNVHLLDLYEYRSLYENASLTGDAISGHYTAIGYQQFAEILRIVWSEYINNNIKSFQNVHLIEYDS